MPIDAVWKLFKETYISKPERAKQIAIHFSQDVLQNNIFKRSYKWMLKKNITNNWESNHMICNGLINSNE